MARKTEDIKLDGAFDNPGEDNTITYSFHEPSSTWEGQYDINSSTETYFSDTLKGSLSGTSEDVLKDVVGDDSTAGIWELYSSVDFSELTTSKADINFFTASDLSQDALTAWFSTDTETLPELPLPGDYVRAEVAFLTDLADDLQGHWRAMHEVGHALGLVGDLTISGTDSVLDDGEYTQHMTIMSYFVPDSGYYVANGVAYYPALNEAAYSITPMAYDIMAIIEQFGSFDSNTGSTTYDSTWFANWGITGNSSLAMTIVDTDGSADEIDLSGFSGSHVIDLREAIKEVGADDIWQDAPTIINGEDYIYIAHDSEVENATGGAGNDTIYGNELTNVLVGNAGDDVLYGGDGTDTLYGGDDNDTYVFQFEAVGTDHVIDSDGSGMLQFVDAGGTPINLTGKAYYTDNNTYEMTKGGETFKFTVVGSNDLEVRDGGDRLFAIIKDFIGSTYLGIELTGPQSGGVTGSSITGTSGDDTLNGGADDDTIYGVNGDDLIYGNAGNDRIILGAGAEVVYGGSGNDLISGISTGDTVYGEAGDDTLSGAEVYGGDGDDFIGGMNNEGWYGTLSGGAGNDIIRSRASGDTIIIDVDPNTTDIIQNFNSGEYKDYIDLSDFSNITDFSDLIITSNTAGDAKVYLGNGQYIVIEDYAPAQLKPEYFIGGAASGGVAGDTITGTSANETLTGSTEDDVVDATAGGNNTISVLGGADSVTAGSGNDTIDGGTGADTIDAGAGNDLVEGNKGNDSILGGDGDDTLYGGLKAGVDTDGGNDTISGGSGNDYIHGGMDGDLLSGDGGNDTILGGVDGDTISGGDGNDSLTGGNGVDADTAADSISGGAGNDTLIGGDYNDTLDGGDGDDEIFTGDGDNLVIASLGNDTIHNSDGDDTLLGGAGNDLIITSGGDDSLDGGEGDDILFTAGGNNTVTGGSGTDTFVIDVAAGGTTTITDFDAGSETIDLSHFTAIDDASDMTISGSTDTTISLGGGQSIILTGVNSASIDNSDFSFVSGSHVGTDSSETINGTTGADTLVGGKGNDTLNGSTGNDEYHYSLGDGDDIITDTGGTDKIVFGYGISRDDITISRSAYSGGVDGTHGYITINSTGDVITLNTIFHDTLGPDRQIESIEFEDGSPSLSATDIANEAKIIRGTSGADNLFGQTDTDNTVIGGAGNDSLDSNGASTSDTYVFSLGDGNDRINDYGGTDKLTFTEGVSRSDIVISRSAYTPAGGGIDGNHLLVTVASTGDVITVNNFFNDTYGTARQVEGIDFEDGTTSYSTSDLIDAAKVTRGTSGNDTLYGQEDADNTLIGGAGNDRLESYGTDTDDSYYFSAGDGDDRINDQGGTDKVVFTDDISIDDIVLSRSAATSITNGNNGIITIIPTGDEIELYNFFNSTYGTTRQIESIEFEDGSDTLSLSEMLAAMQVIEGGSGNDTIYGHSDQDDDIRGNAGNDVLSGKAGDDTLTGGAGNDQLTGGSDADTFVISLNGGDTDTITDFDETETGEVIDLSAFTSITWGNLSTETWNTNHTRIDLGGSQYLVINNILPGELSEGDFIFYQQTDESLTGSFNADSIVSGAGADTLTGNEGDDTLDGGAGNDSLLGGADEDSILGGSGNDTLDGGADDDILDGEDGDDVLYGDDGDDTLEGGNGTDQLYGEDGDDYLIIDNDDFTSGTVSGGSGHDTVELTGTTATSLVLATYGLESAIGTDGGNDSLNASGQTEDGYLEGRGGNDTLNAGDGNDSLVGGDGNDVLYGREGNDTLDGGNGNDTILGHGGDDVVYVDADDVSSGYIDGGTGTNTLYVNGTTGVSLNFNIINIQKVYGSDGGNDSLNGVLATDVKEIYGRQGDDTLGGGDESDLLHGGQGNDVLLGREGDDLMFGGVGNDVMTGHEGDDTLTGGDGNDSFYGSAGNDVFYIDAGDSTFDGGADYDTAYIEGDTGMTLNLYSTSIEEVHGSEVGADNLNAQNKTENVVIYGYGGADTINGGNGNDYLSGGAGVDGLLARAGNDTLDGGAGADTLSAYEGDDYLYVDSDDVTSGYIDGGTGTDTIDVTGTTGVSLTAYSKNVEIIYGSYLGDDSLQAGSVTAGIELYGRAGDDTLAGGGYADTLNGGQGVDQITGGSGADVFDYNSNGASGTGSGNRDIITDFVTGTDQIDLSDFVGTFTFQGTSAFTGTASEVRYTQTGGNTIVEIDSDADGTADLEIELTGTITLVGGDFIL